MLCLLEERHQFILHDQFPPQGRELHKAVDTRRQELLWSILEAAYHRLILKLQIWKDILL